MTASTPPLVDVIEAAIYKARWVDNFGKETVLATDEAIARAVLDALTEAGGVEWSVATRDGVTPAVAVTEESARRMSAVRGRVLITRTVGPWERAG